MSSMTWQCMHASASMWVFLCWCCSNVQALASSCLWNLFTLWSFRPCGWSLVCYEGITDDLLWLQSSLRPVWGWKLGQSVKKNSEVKTTKVRHCFIALLYSTVCTGVWYIGYCDKYSIQVIFKQAHYFLTCLHTSQGFVVLNAESADASFFTSSSCRYSV